MSMIARLESDPKGLIGSTPLIVAGNPLLKVATHEQKRIAFQGGESVQLIKQSAKLSVVGCSLASEHGKYKLYIPPGSGDNGSCYYLPWEAGKAYAITLGRMRAFSPPLTRVPAVFTSAGPARLRP